MSGDFYQRLKEAFPDPLRTERLVIRPVEPTPTDATAFTDFYEADRREFASVWWYLPKTGSVPAESSFFIETLIPAIQNKAKNDSTCHFYVFNNDESKILGLMEFYADEQKRLRLSYYISPPLRRQGYCREAYSACLAQVQKAELVQSLYAETATWNDASKSFLLSMGFEDTGEAYLRKDGEILGIVNTYRKTFQKPAAFPKPSLP